MGIGLYSLGGLILSADSVCIPPNSGRRPISIVHDDFNFVLPLSCLNIDVGQHFCSEDRFSSTVGLNSAADSVRIPLNSGSQPISMIYDNFKFVSSLSCLNIDVA